MMLKLSSRRLPCRLFVKRHSSTGILYSEKRVLGYTAQEMFNVVSQVESYHKFVPWCKKSQVISRHLCGLQADLVIGFPPILSESYTSHVTLFEPHLVTAVCTDMKLFNKLKTVWKFDDSAKYRGIEDSCTLEFAVNFEFAKGFYSQLSSYFFDEVVKQNVKAFLHEVERRYGPERIPKQRPTVFTNK